MKDQFQKMITMIKRIAVKNYGYKTLREQAIFLNGWMLGFSKALEDKMRLK